MTHPAPPFAILCAALLAQAAAPARGDPVEYRLLTDQSQVEFLADLGGQPLRGEIPVAAAQLWLDFTDLPASRVSVTLATAQARADLPFVQGALRGEGVLDAAHFPTARFASTALRGSLPGPAVVEGRLTLRGITRPLALRAEILRPAGSAPDDLDRLTLHLQGALRRSDFGADAMPDLVGDRVGLDITVRIRRAH